MEEPTLLETKPVLRLRIARNSGSLSWRWSGTRWQSGDNWVEPISHPAVEVWSGCDGSRNAFVVRERQPTLGSAATADPLPYDCQALSSAIADARRWPGAYLLVESDGDGRIQVTTGAHGTAPVYLAVQAGVLHGSWDMADLSPYIDAERLVPGEVARRLTMTARYSPRTVFGGVFLLTERATAFFDEDVEMKLPEAVPHALPRELAEGAPVVDAFERLLTASVVDRFHDPAASAVELSGGMDSANVALSLALLHGPRIRSGALMLDGPAGVQQSGRRDEMIAMADFRDTTVCASDLPPLHPSGARARGMPLGPQEEIYHEAFTELLNRWTAAGVRYSFSGVGGDEMMMLPPERPTRSGMPPESAAPWLGTSVRDALHSDPAHVVPMPGILESTLMAMACGAPMYLRAGVWPVYPLADPALLRFGQWLPRRWKVDKRLVRDRLEVLGFSRDVAHPRLRENFHDVLGVGLHRYGGRWIRRMLVEGSLLFELGFVSPDGLRDTAHRLDRGPVTEAEGRVFQVLSLDLALKAFRSSPAGT